MERTIIHVILHFFVPFTVAKLVWKEKWIRQFLIMLFTNTVDLDHLFAEPIFDQDRCSIGKHPLHSWLAICVYISCLLSPHLRILSLGLLIHMTLDGIDCLFLF